MAHPKVLLSGGLGGHGRFTPHLVVMGGEGAGGAPLTWSMKGQCPGWSRPTCPASPLPLPLPLACRVAHDV